MAIDEQIDYSQFTSQSLEELRDAQNRFLERRKERFRPVQTVGALIPKVMSIPDYIPIPVPDEPKKLTYDEGSELLFKCIKRRHSRQDWKFVFTEEQKVTVRNLIRYFLDDPACIWNLRKGIYLWGDTGRGKTEVMNLFRDFTREIKSMQFEIASTRGIVFDLAKEKDVGVLSQYFTGHKCFDDFGFEEATANVYGNNIKVMEAIIDERDRYNLITHATSNVRPSMLELVYGKRTVSRCEKMFNFVEFTGIDHRRK